MRSQSTAGAGGGDRRDFLKKLGLGAASLAVGGLGGAGAEVGGVTDGFNLSPEQLAFLQKMWEEECQKLWAHRAVCKLSKGTNATDTVKGAFAVNLEVPPEMIGTPFEPLHKAYRFAGELAWLFSECPRPDTDSDCPTEVQPNLRHPLSLLSPGAVDKAVKLVEEGFEKLEESPNGDVTKIEPKYLREALQKYEQQLSEFVEGFKEQPLVVSLKQESEREGSPLAPYFKTWWEALTTGRGADLQSDPVLSLLGRLYMNEADFLGMVPSDCIYELKNPDEWEEGCHPGYGCTEEEIATMKRDSRYWKNLPDFVYFAFSRQVEREVLAGLRDKGINFSVDAIYPPADAELFNRCDRMCETIERLGAEGAETRLTEPEKLQVEDLRKELINHVTNKGSRSAAWRKSACGLVDEIGLPRPFFYLRNFKEALDASSVAGSAEASCESGVFTWSSDRDWRSPNYIDYTYNLSHGPPKPNARRAP